MDVEQITEIITSVINNIGFNLFSDIEDNAFMFLNKLIFVNKDIINTSLLKKLISYDGNFSNSLLNIVNIFLWGIILFYVSRRLLSYHLGISNIDNPFQFFSKLVLCSTFAFFSLEICSGIIDLNYKCTLYILNIPSLEISSELGDKTISFTTLKYYMDKEDVFSDDEDFNIFSLDGVIRGFINFGIVTLVITYSLRYILLKVLTILAPFAFLCMIDKGSEFIFKGWLKAFMTLVFIQTFIAVILIIPIALINQLPMQSEEYLLNKIFLAGAIYTLYKANDFVREIFGGFGITANIQSGFYMLRNLMRG